MFGQTPDFKIPLAEAPPGTPTAIQRGEVPRPVAFSLSPSFTTLLRDTALERGN